MHVCVCEGVEGENNLNDTSADLIQSEMTAERASQ